MTVAGSFARLLRTAVLVLGLAALAMCPAHAQTRTVLVNIVTVHDVPVTEGIVCGFTEYFGRIRFNRGRFLQTHTQSVCPGCGGFISPVPFDFTPARWSTGTLVTIPAGGAASTRVDVQVWESDSFPCGSNDQLVIAPGGARTISFRVVNWPTTCIVTEVTGTAGIRGGFTCGEPFTVRIRRGCTNCRGVTLRVDIF